MEAVKNSSLGYIDEETAMETLFSYLDKGFERE